MRPPGRAMAGHQEANSHRRWSRSGKLRGWLTKIVRCMLVAEIGHYCEWGGLMHCRRTNRDNDVDDYEESEEKTLGCELRSPWNGERDTWKEKGREGYRGKCVEQREDRIDKSNFFMGDE